MKKIGIYVCCIITVFAAVWGIKTGIGYFKNAFIQVKNEENHVIKNEEDNRKSEYLFTMRYVNWYNKYYDGYIVGGSKTGAFRAETVGRLDGYKYYNVAFSGGNFTDYLATIEYLLEHTKTKKIVLSLGSTEVNRKIKGGSQDLSRVPVAIVQEEQYEKHLHLVPEKAESYISHLKEVQDGLYDHKLYGQRDFSGYYMKMKADPEGFIAKNVTKNFDKQMKRLFTEEVVSEHYDYNLEQLKKIKQMCVDKGVELLVVIAPAFIGELSEFESEAYRDYLRRMAEITDYWDFSGISNISLNPYNFYNSGHCLYELVDLMVEIMKGEVICPGFGTYVTKENFAEYRKNREKVYNQVKRIYEKQGNITLFDYNHESMVCRHDS